MGMQERLHEKLTAAFAPTHLDIIDDSHKHAGHVGVPEEGETHFRVLIVSDAFQGKSRVERQRMVYDLLAIEFQEGVHALSLVTRTVEEERVRQGGD